MLNYQRVDWKKIMIHLGIETFQNLATLMLWYECGKRNSIHKPIPKITIFMDGSSPIKKRDLFSLWYWDVLSLPHRIIPISDFSLIYHLRIFSWWLHGEFTFDLAEKSPWTSSSRHPDHGGTKKLLSCRSLEDLLCFEAPFLLRFRRASCWPGAMITAPALGHGKVPWGVRKSNGSTHLKTWKRAQEYGLHEVS